MDKDVYMKIKGFTYKNDLIAHDELFECSNFEELGEFIFNVVKSNCMNDVESIESLKAVLLHPKKMEDFESDSFFEVLAKEKCGFVELPMIAYNKGLEIVDEVLTKISLFKTQYEQRNNEILVDIGILLDQINDLKSKVTCDRNVMKDLIGSENDKKRLTNNKRNLELELQQRKHIYKYFEETVKKITNSTDRVKKLYATVISVSKKDNTDEVADAYKYLEYDLGIYRKLLEEYDNVFYISKFYYISNSIYKKYRSMMRFNDENHDVVEQYEGEMDELPSIDDLRLLRKNDLTAYKEKMKMISTNYNLVKFLKDGIESNYCLKQRKSLLINCLKYYEENNFITFNNLMVSQVEGMVNDFMNDITTFLRLEDYRELDIPILRNVLEFLKDVGKEIPLELYVYFFYYYVERVRNPIAHGDYSKCIADIDDETLAVELIMDAVSVVYLIEDYSESSRFKNLFKSMFRLIFNTGDNSDNRFYGLLLNELSGSRLHLSYNSIEYMNGIELLYWAFNPYYDDLVSFYNIGNEVNRFKSILCSTEFWIFVNKEIDDFMDDKTTVSKFTADFVYVINRMFKVARSHNPSCISQLVVAKNKLQNFYQV